MSRAERRALRKPSWWWLLAAATCVVAAVASFAVAVVKQRASDRPAGEGELFLAEAGQVAASVPAAADPDLALRSWRNDLGIEGISLVAADGLVAHSTSAAFVDARVTDGVLAYGLAEGRFAAVATALDAPLVLDGVTEWDAGDVVYQVLHPLEGGGAVVLYYDIAELLGRRARATGIRPLTMQLAGVSVALLLLAGLLLFGRWRAARRFRELEIEADLLRRHGDELEERNAALDAARQEAERALQLAEEKIRIRAEFVLMINHELRTPLTSVVTGAELLQAGELGPSERAALIEAIVHDGRRLQEMISRMLVVAHIENRGLDYELRDVPLLDVCALIESAHPRIAVAHDPSLPAPVLDGLRLRTDPQTLTHLVASLTDNAYTHGATSVIIRCQAQLDFEPMVETGNRPAEAAWFLIADNGPGIDPDFLPRAFEKFEKHGFTSGTGLGLYTARLMADAIGASLAVQTSPEGTTLAIAVPLTAAAAEEAAA